LCSQTECGDVAWVERAAARKGVELEPTKPATVDIDRDDHPLAMGPGWCRPGRELAHGRFEPGFAAARLDGADGTLEERAKGSLRVGAGRLILDGLRERNEATLGVGRVAEASIHPRL